MWTSTRRHSKDFSGQISEWKCYIEEEHGNTWLEFDWLIFMFLWKAEISLLQCCCLFNIGFICICQQKGAERPERGGDGLWGLAWQRWRWQILTGEIWIPLMQEAHTHKNTHASHLSNTNSSPSFTQGFLMHHSRDLQGWGCRGAQRRDVESFFLHPPSACKIEGG